MSIFNIILIIWVALDLFTKYLANIFLQNKVNILWDFLYFKYIENPWIAFWIKIYPIFLKIITISLIILIFRYYKEERKKYNVNIWKNKEKLLSYKKIIDISFSLIIAWAIWNWIERVFNSYVIDFIWIKYFSIFNLADSFITIWAIFYIYLLYNTNKICDTDQKK